MARLRAALRLLRNLLDHVAPSLQVRRLSSPGQRHQRHASAGEMAWRENNRREANGSQAAMVTRSAMVSPVSRQWNGYWQREYKKGAGVSTGPDA
jgi:hypothetical protein